jgi:hypothetical protein
VESHLKHPKYGIPVRVVLTNQDAILGLVYVQWGQRIRDVLCEKEAFLPVKATKGTLLVNKAAVVHVDLLSVSDIAEKKELFPEIDFDYLSRNAW